MQITGGTFTIWGEAMVSTASTAKQDEMLSLEEAADVLSVSKSTLYRMIERKEVKGRKVGRQWRFSRADVQAYLDRGPQAVVLASVGKEEVDALLPSLAEASQRLGREMPVVDPSASAEAKVTVYITQLLKLAVTASASDIHWVPERQSTVVQLRIDGVLHELCRIPATAYPAVMIQLKQMVCMNIEERSWPQDGRLHFTIGERNYDARVNVLPTVFGESAVLRILDQSNVMIGLARLNFTPEDLARLESWLRIPSGLILMTGPTGSGKTTTAYSCLTQIAKPELCTLTIEDPVEYLLPHTRQSSVIRRTGLTFSVALRAFMRHDPDVIFVGEIRDLETAEIVMQAALTGHLVLSQLMPDTAVGALTRLVEMGVEPFLVSGAVHGVIAQRLLRRICPHCKAPVAVPDAVLAHMRELAWQGGYTLPDDAQFYHGTGCEHCFQRGYRGRTAIYSLLEMTPAVREAVLRRASDDELTRIAIADGMRTLFADGIRKAVEGMTTVDEVFRVTQA